MVVICMNLIKKAMSDFFDLKLCSHPSYRFCARFCILVFFIYSCFRVNENAIL